MVCVCIGVALHLLWYVCHENWSSPPYISYGMACVLQKWEPYISYGMDKCGPSFGVNNCGLYIDQGLSSNQFMIYHICHFS